MNIILARRRFGSEKPSRKPLFFSIVLMLAVGMSAAYGADLGSDASPPSATAAEQRPAVQPDSPEPEGAAATVAEEGEAAPPPVPVPAAPAAPAVDPEQVAKAAAAAKAVAEEQAVAERKEKREEEKRAQLAEAERFVTTADDTVTHLPYPLNILLGVSIFGITLWRWLTSAALFVAAIFLFLYVSHRFRKADRVIKERTATSKWQLARNVAFVALRLPLKIVIIGLLVRSVNALLVTAHHPDILWVSDTLVFLGFVAYLYELAGVVDQVYGARIFHSDNRLMDTVRPIILKCVRAAILVVACIQIYQQVTGRTMVSVLAGLGIGGLALALASQTTLQNLLGFASIAFDKAFLVGDAVNIADYEGTVEHVGIRSMRLRTYDGRSVVIPNNNAINSNIVNLNRRPYIRREMRVYLSPLNSYGKIEEAMQAIREAVEGHDGKVPGLEPTVRFVDFEPARFVIQALFWYDSDKQPYYLDECSRINLEVAKRLCEAGVLYAER